MKLVFKRGTWRVYTETGFRKFPSKEEAFAYITELEPVKEEEPEEEPEDGIRDQ